jgi:hypothetical protein
MDFRVKEYSNIECGRRPHVTRHAPYMKRLYPYAERDEIRIYIYMNMHILTHTHTVI